MPDNGAKEGKLTLDENIRYNLLMLWHYSLHLALKWEYDVFNTKAGLPYNQFVVLLQLHAMNKPIKVTELARLIDRNSNSVSMIIDRMVKDDLVKRARDNKDRRVAWLSITRKGNDELARASKITWDLMAAPFTHFTKDELIILGRLEAKVRKYILRELNMDETNEKVWVSTTRPLVDKWAEFVKKE